MTELNRAGIPAVVLAAEAFEKLLKVVLRAREAPEMLAIVLKGNPEYLDGPELTALADKVLDEAVRRLTSGAGAYDTPVE